MLRLVGLVMIVGLSITTGTYLGKVYGFRVEDLKNFKKALVILKSEIEYMGTPLSQALQNIGDKLSPSVVSSVFYEASTQLEAHVPPDLALESSLTKYQPQMYLLADDQANLKSFGKTLGYLDKELQLNNIALTLNYLDQRIQEEIQNQIKYKKLYQTLGILAGLLAVVVLI